MARIVFGSGTYTMQRFTPSELGLFDSSFEGYEFSIVRKYAHLYWLPLFPIGTLYAVKKPGEKDKYEVTDPNLISLMQQHKLPFWKHLGCFALPLLLVSGFILYIANTFVDDYKFQSAYNAQIAAVNHTMADTAALRPAANQFRNLVYLLELTDLEKIPKLKKIDTSRTQLFMLLLDCINAKRDTTIRYTKENTFICDLPANLVTGTTEFDRIESNLLVKYSSLFHCNNLDNIEVLSWYKSNFTRTTPNIQGYVLTEVKEMNKNLNNFKYFVKANAKGLAYPTFNFDINRFSSGYILADITVYEIGPNKVVDKFDMLFGNSESISFTQNPNESSSKTVILQNLQQDLLRNYHDELMVSLRITERKMY